MSHNKKFKPLAITLGTAFAAGIGSTSAANAEENPFGLAKLSEGYMVAEKGAEGKCGEGKCGGEKAKAKEGKCGEGKCGGEKSKAKVVKCGEGKCGGAK